jgi:hypothetical protein
VRRSVDPKLVNTTPMVHQLYLVVHFSLAPYSQCQLFIYSYLFLLVSVRGLISMRRSSASVRSSHRTIFGIARTVRPNQTVRVQYGKQVSGTNEVFPFHPLPVLALVRYPHCSAFRVDDWTCSLRGQRTLRRKELCRYSLRKPSWIACYGFLGSQKMRSFLCWCPD